MISANGWIDWALDDYGPDWKVNGGRNGLVGLAAHSAEGYERAMNDVLKGTRRASWQLSNMKDGRLKQHYSLLQQTWTSGAGWPNNNLIGMESEGVAGEPLTPQQVSNIVRFLKDFAVFSGRANLVRNPQTWGNRDLFLMEHKESIRFGGAATACPSNRYPWATIINSYYNMQSDPPIEELMTMNPLWATWRDRPAGENPPYRTYLLFATLEGLYKYFVPSAEEHNALKATGMAGDEPKELSIWTLKTFEGGPEPDERI